MTNKDKIFAGGGFLSETYRQSGLTGCLKKITAAMKMYAPIFTLGRRTNKSVGAYFDLITDDARLFYGDSFHFGFFRTGSENMDEALSNHTDIVAEMACISKGARVLDIGCGICAPAIRIAKKHECHITCVNISAEQVRQGKACVEKEGLCGKIDVGTGNALELNFEDCSFDSILCLEVAGDICVTKDQKSKLAREIYRLLKPGGHVGFSDLVFTGIPTREEDRSMRAVLYHEGAELVTDWPSIFEAQGFKIEKEMDIIKDTMKTWDHSLSVYENHAEEVNKRYGKRIANQTREHLRRIPEIMQKYGSFVLMSARRLG